MNGLLYIRFFVSLLYAAATVSYFRLLLRQGKGPNRSTPLLIAAISVHFGELLARGAEAGAAGGAPFVGLSGFMSMFAFLVAVIYLFLEHRHRVYTLGAFHLPVILIFQAVAAIIRTPIGHIPSLRTGHLFVLHVVPSAIAYGAFTVSFVTAVAFLLLDRQLRKKKFGLLMRGLPNLDLVEAVNVAGVRIGVVLLLIGAATGMVMGYREWGNHYRWDLKNWITLLIIATYTSQLVLRRFHAFGGRRSVLLSIIGFIMIVCGFTIINVFFSHIHSVT